MRVVWCRRFIARAGSSSSGNVQRSFAAWPTPASQCPSQHSDNLRAGFVLAEFDAVVGSASSKVMADDRVIFGDTVGDDLLGQWAFRYVQSGPI